MCLLRVCRLAMLCVMLVSVTLLWQLIVEVSILKCWCVLLRLTSATLQCRALSELDRCVVWCLVRIGWLLGVMRLTQL